MARAALPAPWFRTLTRLQARRQQLDRLRRHTRSPALREILHTLWLRAFQAEQTLRQQLPRNRSPQFARCKQSDHAWARAETLSRTPAHDAWDLQTRRSELACLIETVRSCR